MKNEVIKMVSKEEISLIKPGYKIIAKVIYKGKEIYAIYTIKELLETYQNTIMFKDKYDETKIIPINDIRSILIPRKNDTINNLQSTSIPHIPPATNENKHLNMKRN